MANMAVVVAYPLGMLDVVTEWVGTNVNLVVVAAYLVLMLALGLYLARYVQKDSDYFLAGRSLNKWVIAGTVMATNVAAIYLVGPAGAAFGTGVAVLLIAWTGNMIAAGSALLFVPRLRRLGVTTISEFLQQRYGAGVRVVTAVWWMLFYALFAGTAMYTLATVLAPQLHMSAEAIILFVGGGVILYCFLSGLLAVVYSDVIQAFLIILGGLVLLPMALKNVGGIEAFITGTQALPGDRFVFWKAPAPGIISTMDVLMYTILGLSYWCTSQYMLQRSFAGRTVRDASRGLIIAALVTGPITLAYIVPGMCAALKYGPTGLGAGDPALPTLIRDVLPVGLGGLLIAAIVAASNSTASSLLNSLATLGENDVYRRIFRKAGSTHYLWAARGLTLAGGALGIWFAFSVPAFGGILNAIYSVMGLFEPPIFIIVAAALFWRRANIWGVLTVLVACLVYNLAFLNQGVLGTYLSLLAVVSEQAPIWLSETICSAREGVGLNASGLPVAACTIYSFGVLAVAMLAGTSISVLFGAGKGRTEQTTTLFHTMLAPSGRDKAPKWAWIGVGLSALSLIVFVWAAFNEDSVLLLVGAGWNIFVFMGSMMLFVLGCLIAVPIFVEKQDIPAEAAEAGITHSWINRVLGNGWSWLVIFTAAVTLMLVLYYT